MRFRLPAGLLATLLLAGPAVALVPAELVDLRTCGIGDLSPDGRLLIYTVGEYDAERAEVRTRVHLRDLDDGRDQLLFTPDDRAGRFAFAPDGQTVAFTRGGDDGDEVWLMGADGTDRRRLAGPGRFGDLVWSPDGTALAFVRLDREPGYEGRVGEITVADDLGWRHLGLGEREGRLRQAHVLELETGEVRALPAPNLDVRELAWSPDGRRLVLSAKHRRALGRTLDTELWIVARDGTGLRRLSRNPGPDIHPIWLDDGTIAAQSHPDSLHESRPAAIVVRDAADGRTVATLAGAFGDVVWGFWHHEGTFYLRGARRGSAGLFVAGADGERRVGPEGWNFWDVRFGGRRAVLWGTTLTNPGSLLLLDLQTGRTRTLLDPNGRWAERVELAEPERFTVTVEGRAIEGWVFRPDEAVSGGQPAPTVLSIHGGPEWMYGAAFLPEFHVLPTFGYAVLAANPTGSTGYGPEFLADIQGDWVGRPARELMAVVDHAVAMGWSDPDLLAVMGGSYGGHLGAALTTQTDRFAAAALDRMYPQTAAFWGATDEKWFPEWEFGGRPFDDHARETYRRNDPFEQVDRVTTPTLLSHGLRDFRCPEDGTVGWFSALQALGVPTRLLRFHDEGHGIGGRANQIFYLEQVLAWFDRWVLEAAAHE
jgi:dipeptidyl aminopeptidase/acylaminoacyl peptidase